MDYFPGPQKKGVRIFEDTKNNGKKLEKENATFFTENHHSIKARFAIITAGYEGNKRDSNEG